MGRGAGRPAECDGGGATVKHLDVAFIMAIAMTIAGCHKADKAEEKPEPTLVKTAVAEEGPITEWVELQGRVAPPYDRDATLSPQVPGRIVFLAARVGLMVSAGAVLAK